MPIAPGADAKNRVRASTSEESSELGEYELVTIECDVVRSMWDAALSSGDDALALVQWMDANREPLD